LTIEICSLDRQVRRSDAIVHGSEDRQDSQGTLGCKHLGEHLVLVSELLAGLQGGDGTLWPSGRVLL
jgi:hypothetical protein